MSKPIAQGKVNLEGIYRTIKAYHEGKISKKSTIKELKDISPMSLLKVEQALLNKGFTITDLKGISDVYAEIFYDRSKEMINRLEFDHPIRVLLVEHAMIKSFLSELSLMRDDLANTKKTVNRSSFKTLLKNIEELERHYQREENVIFPRLQGSELSARVDILSEEHDSFLNHEIRLIDLSDHIVRNRKKIVDILDYLLAHIRFHAFTEGALLYPVALNVIDDWEVVKEEMEIIGHPDFVAMGNFKPMVKKKDYKLNKTLDELSEEEPVYSGYLIEDKGDE